LAGIILKNIRSVSFDTSFLLKERPGVDKVLKELKRDSINCYITATVLSELEMLKNYDRINEQLFKLAMSRWKHVGGNIINFKNRLLSEEIKKECVESMGKHHGVSKQDIINDCNILVTSLKNGVDLFLSEDFHFTSKITLEVLNDVTNNACKEYYQMCGEEMYCVDTLTFLEAYNRGIINIKIIEALRQNIRKPGKSLKDQVL
jgi:rRNA-processing protein FCF1